MLDDVVVRHPVGLSAPDEHAVGNGYAQRAHIVVEHKLVVCHCLHEHVRCGVGHADEVEIALQDAVLTRHSVDGDVAEVGAHALSALVVKGEVVAIYLAA